MSRVRRVVVAGAVVVLVAAAVVAIHVLSPSGSSNSGTPTIARPHPSYLPRSAKLSRAYSGIDHFGRAIGWIEFYALPGALAPGSAYFPFRFIEIQAFENPVLPVVASGVRNGPPELSRAVDIDGVPGKLYFARGMTGQSDIEWLRHGVVTEVSTCNACGIPLAQLREVADGLVH